MTLDEIVKKCRELGIAHFRGHIELDTSTSTHEVEFTLGEAPPENVKEVDKPRRSGKAGKDGLTAEQQEELYGRPYSDTEE